MTEPQHIEGLTDNRLEGEFYYATWDDDPDYSDGTFEIHRQSDGKEIVKWFHGDDGARPDAESALKAFDAEARRLIDTERERAKADFVDGWNQAVGYCHGDEECKLPATTEGGES